MAELLASAHREGHAWADMAILCRNHSEMDMCAEFLRKRKLPHQLRKSSSSMFYPAHDCIKVMTLHVSKGLEFPVEAMVGAGRMPAEGEDEREEARLLYAGVTRATQRLVIGASGGGRFAARLWAKGKTSYLPPVGSISEENENVEQAGRDDAGKTLGHGNID